MRLVINELEILLEAAELDGNDVLTKEITKVIEILNEEASL